MLAGPTLVNYKVGDEAYGMRRLDSRVNDVVLFVQKSSRRAPPTLGSNFVFASSWYSRYNESVGLSL